MAQRPLDLGEGLTVLDGVALVAGAAVGSVHLRGLIAEDFFGPGWAVVWGTFVLVGLTATGPFLYTFRRYVRGPLGYPRTGDRLWALLGLPWLVTALLRNTPDTVNTPHRDLVSSALSIGLTAVCLIAVSVVWVTWVKVSPERATEAFAGSWSHRMGLCLAIAWPLQCGGGMVVVSQAGG